MEPQFWGDISAVDHSQCISLINRVKDITGSINLAPIFNPFGKASLLKAIEAFVKDEDSRVLSINLQYLSFAHHAREIVANATGRHLMSLAQQGLFRQKPLLVVVDEAHQFFDKHLTDPEGDYPLDAFALIAKEGRKYALSVCMATQRPRDIPEGVLSQMGTLIVHRLINDLDRGVVERACGEMNRACLDALPGLAPGEAIILGAGFPMPLHVRVEAPMCPPNSMGADYQQFWR
jgi:DNA helicase HerA-like ATPase